MINYIKFLIYLAPKSLLFDSYLGGLGEGKNCPTNKRFLAQDIDIYHNTLLSSYPNFD